MIHYYTYYTTLSQLKKFKFPIFLKKNSDSSFYMPDDKKRSVFFHLTRLCVKRYVVVKQDVLMEILRR
ncbi:MAG: hypothetical protein A2Y13_04145 [Planctomycetes bacterium GWC2_45_44]|nr:MAG: hypothetical protein A2Y13_04145 [Planctomycetes bacterium GWC2_45_44]